MFRAAFDAAQAVHAVGIVENAVFCRGGREEAEWTDLGAKSAFDAGVGYADAALAGMDCLVYLAHWTDRTPEKAVEDQPADDSDSGCDGDHDVQEHTPATERGRAKPDGQPREHRNHHEDRRLAFQETRRNFAPRIRQQRVEGPTGAEIAAPVASSMTERPQKAHRHVDEQTIRKIGITPSQRQDRLENQRLNMAFHCSIVPFHFLVMCRIC